MGRAIAAISGSAAGFLPGALLRPLIGYVRGLGRQLFNSYHPEQHYMRGPGPACRAKTGHVKSLPPQA
ncbi:MAG: hypothetical protein AB7O50_03385 [Pseudolabrys sp.]